MSIPDYLKSFPLYILPHHFISRLVFRLTRIHSPLVPRAIRIFCKLFRVDLSEAQITDPEQFETFNAFFTRALKAGQRPLAEGKEVFVSPVDGAVSQLGAIRSGRIFQAKGHEYSALELLGGNVERAAPFMDGQFITIYLSPRDYHRIHMPLEGKLVEQVYVPGRLFSVAPHTTRTIPRLFARNERVVSIFDTEWGKLALVLVGAINVAAIETVWSGLITPPAGKAITEVSYPGDAYEKGIEMGRFNMGSTVVVLLETSRFDWDELCDTGVSVRMGQALGQFTQG